MDPTTIIAVAIIALAFIIVLIPKKKKGKTGENKANTMSEKDQKTLDIKTNISDGLCPRCGKPLVKHNSKYGGILRCSGYPGCKFKTTL